MEPAPIIAILMGMVFLLASIVLLANPGETMLPDFDKLWDYQHPAETEKKFVGLLPAAEKSEDISYLAQLLTQIARAQGLQEKFDEANKTLDRASVITRDDMMLPQVRTPSIARLSGEGDCCCTRSCACARRCRG